MTNRGQINEILKSNKCFALKKLDIKEGDEFALKKLE